MGVRRAIDPCEFQNRCVGIGVNTILLLRSQSGTDFVVHNRIGSTAEAVNTHHVVPAGTFQPRSSVSSADDPDFSLYANILREFAEELLGETEAEESRTNPRALLDIPTVGQYKRFFDDGGGGAYYLGWAMDPLTTKAEVLTALVVDADAFLRRFGRKLSFTDNWEGEHKLVPFNLGTATEFVQGDRTLPAGAGCTALAWRNKEQLIPSR
jgi:hypothetical protein